MSKIASLQYLSYKALPDKIYKQQLSSYIKGQAHQELVNEIISQKQKSVRDNKESKDNLIRFFRHYYKDNAFQFLLDSPTGKKGPHSPLLAFLELKVGKNIEMQVIYLLSKFYSNTLKDFINFVYDKYDKPEKDYEEEEYEEEEYEYEEEFEKYRNFHLPPKYPIDNKSERIKKIIEIFKILRYSHHTNVLDSLLNYFDKNLSLLLKNLDISFLKEYKNYLEQFN